jgi:hypothetical protein
VLSMASVMKVCHTLLVMVEPGLVILKFRWKTPTLATCERCQLKFLTPTEMMEDSDGAERYLLTKYRQHRCNRVPPVRAAATVASGGKSESMKYKMNLIPLRHESEAQDRSNERKTETKRTERLLAILARKLGTPKKPSMNPA